ncbi:MAG TPA: hypothetical protein GX012_00855 [Acholeplasma sp.]|nr:hypothetical protein [Acholeplasma sp.]
MILQKLYNDYNFNIELILTSEYKKLGLNSNELIILLVLFSNKSKKKIFSLASIARKVEFNQNEIANIVTGLLEKDFIEIKLETHNKKEREIYSLDKTFQQVQNMIVEEIKNDLQQENKSNISETITLLENKLNRILRPNELERVRLWYDTYNFDHIKIISTINNLDKNITIIKVEKILDLDIEEPKEIDKEVDDALERIFKKI